MCPKGEGYKPVNAPGLNVCIIYLSTHIQRDSVMSRRKQCDLFCRQEINAICFLVDMQQGDVSQFETRFG
jgi:hypothetical protein